MHKELNYYTNTLNSDMLFDSAWYKLNRIAHEEKLMNFCALLIGDAICQHVFSLPTNFELKAAITIFYSPNIQNEKSADDIIFDKYYVTLIN